MNFITIDFETVNPARSSICQIGVATLRDGQLIDKFESLVDPEDYFDPFTCSVHGIPFQDLIGQPTFPSFYDQLRGMLENQVVICHTSFDRTAFVEARKKYGLEEFPITWLDSSSIARRAWSQFAKQGYGLANITEFLEIDYRAHNAFEDARAAGLVFIEACKVSGLDVDGWLQRVRKRITLRQYGPSHKFVPIVAEDGPFHGETIVITGTLPVTRDIARQMAADLGANVPEDVSKETTMLVLGIQDKSKFNGKDKSSKHLKAERFVRQGLSIEIISGNDFMTLLEIVTE